MIELIEEGGAFVWVLVAIAAWGMVIVLERIMFFQHARVNAGDLLLGLAGHTKKGNYSEAIHEAARAPGPIARVCHSVLLRYDLSRSDLRDIAQEAGQLEVPRMERNLRGLHGIALICPLVGMLGTVSGLIKVFMDMGEESTVQLGGVVSQGVYQSLITTALGLSISISSYLFYLYFLGRTKRLVHRIERAGIEIVNLVSDHKPAAAEALETALEKE